MKILYAALLTVGLSTLTTSCSASNSGDTQYKVTVQQLRQENYSNLRACEHFFRQRGADSLWEQLTKVGEDSRYLKFDAIPIKSQKIIAQATIGYLAGNNIAIIRLVMSKGDFTKLPKELGALTSLQFLTLNDNQLTELPESLGALTNLQWLYPPNNKLKQLPESFGALTNLQSLYLSYNLLESLPESFGALTSLLELYLDNNQLQKLPKSFGALTSLQ